MSNQLVSTNFIISFYETSWMIHVEYKLDFLKRLESKLWIQTFVFQAADPRSSEPAEEFAEESAEDLAEDLAKRFIAQLRR